MFSAISVFVGFARLACRASSEIGSDAMVSYVLAVDLVFSVREAAGGSGFTRFGARRCVASDECTCIGPVCSFAVESIGTSSWNDVVILANCLLWAR